MPVARATRFGETVASNIKTTAVHVFFFQGKRDMQWDNIMFEGNYDGVDVYAQSKLANILFNLELSKRVKCKPHFQINLSILTGYRKLCLAL